MISILEASSRRTISILYMLFETKDWLTIKQFTEALNASEKTIHDDLKKIKQNYSDKIGLEISPTQGFRASAININTFLEIQCDILVSSIPVSFIILLLNSPNCTLNFYAEELHTSRSTLYRIMPNIVTFLKKNQITLQKKQSRYALISDDNYIFRRFFTTFLYEILGSKSPNFVPDDWDTFYKKRIKQIYEENTEFSFDLELGYYAMFYHLSFTNGYHNGKLEYSPYFNGVDIPFDEEDITFLRKKNNPFPLDYFTNIESQIAIHRHSLFNKTTSGFIEESHSAINYLTDTLGIKGMEKEKSFLEDSLIDLCINISYFNIPYFFFYDRYASFSSDIEKENKVIYQLLVNTINGLGAKLGIDFTHYLNHLIYMFVVTLPSMLQVQFDKSILVISNYSKEHSIFISSIIQSQLSISPDYHQNFICIDRSSLQKYDLEDFQLVITNIAIDDTNNSLIIVNDFPSKENIATIKQKFYQLLSI